MKAAKSRPPACYRAPWWLPGGHLQTLYAYFAALGTVRFRRERWETDDGDFIDLDWTQTQAAPSRLVVLLHGLEGCSRSHYAVNLMRELARRGWGGVVAHFRGCSGENNRLARAYHSGDTGEVDWLMGRLRRLLPAARLHAVGVSLGGNVLLKWLGEQGDRAAPTVASAAAVSAPVDLTVAVSVLDRGWNRLLYTRHFLGSLKKKTAAKIAVHGLELDPAALKAASTFREFDALYTAPVHGFESAEQYWRVSSSKPYLKSIAVPTLMINARNDPFFPASSLPGPEEVSGVVTLEYPAAGGHAGFVSGPFPGHLRWLPRRIVRFFAETGGGPGNR
ncbi:MAG TPA: alpha/beta fold hydrolase [candidate division Zixibacteria bacterium]|nr:alpha/beta fold hydrolase [candidate division Zixibacteria bacterium]